MQQHGQDRAAPPRARGEKGPQTGPRVARGMLRGCCNAFKHAFALCPYCCDPPPPDPARNAA
eukprot:1762076-Lingulodinium_polyedra.AAC.1